MEAPTDESTSTWVQSAFRLLLRVMSALAILTGVVYFIAAPPLHWIYEKSGSAGPSSICIQGAGFPGFWYHLGFLQDNPFLRNHEFYCYSSGCLSLLMAQLNATLDVAYGYALGAQRSWLDGNITRYEIVARFVDDLLQHGELEPDFISRTNILVTSTEKGVAAENPTNVEELRDLLIRTTFIPFVTGWGWFSSDDDGGVYVDGGFSRVLHPQCQFDVAVPTTVETVVHAFNPGLYPSQVEKFWLMGKMSAFPTT